MPVSVHSGVEVRARNLRAYWNLEYAAVAVAWYLENRCSDSALWNALEHQSSCLREFIKDI